MTDRSLAARAHTLAARLILPGGLRRDFGLEMTRTFVDLDRQAAHRGVTARARLFVRELRDMVRFRLGGGPRPTPPGKRPSRAWRGLIEIGGDVRFAIRLLRRDAGWTTTALAMLALGLAISGGTWTLVRSALLAPLPYVDADELVQIWSVRHDRNDRDTTISPADFFDIRQQATTLTQVAASNRFLSTLQLDDRATIEEGMWVSPNMFALLGVESAMGTLFDDPVVASGDEPVVVVSDDFWRTRLGADPQAVGGELDLSGRLHRITGVLPASFRYPDPYSPTGRIHLFRPLAWSPESAARRGSRFLVLTARIAPGATVAQANDELRRIGRRLADSHPVTNSNLGLRAASLRDQYYGDLSPYLWAIHGAGLVVFLIVLANVSGLTLVRARRRRPEAAVRVALGAGRGRLLRQVVTESVLLTAAAALGALVALRLVEAPLASLVAGNLPTMTRFAFGGATIAMITLIGAIAAITIAAVGAREMLVVGNRALLPTAAAAGGRVSTTLRGALVTAQVAMTVALVIGAGLLTRSLLALVAVPPGFDADGVALMDVMPPSTDYSTGEELNVYYDTLLARLAALPGAVDVGLVSDLPFLTENRSRTFNFAARPVPEIDQPGTEFRVVSAGYFSAMGIDVIAGRGFDADDGADGAPVVVVNRAFATQFFPDIVETVGDRLLLDTGGEEPTTMSIVGIVDDVRDDGFASEPEPLLYMERRQFPQRGMTVVVRATGSASAMAGAARDVASQLDPRVPLASLRTLRELMRSTLADERLAASIAGAGAILATLLAGLGIYGLMAYLVASRVREIGVRTALGARPRQVVKRVLAHALLLTATGAVIGLGVGVAASRFLASVLFGVAPIDPLVFAATPLLLCGVAMVACALPAWRAARVSPVVALRS